jgi:anti-anti-sigma factor
MTHGRYTIVNITGDVDFYPSRWLQEHLLRFLPRGGTQLVVNLSRVTFIDRRGLRTLLVISAGGEEFFVHLLRLYPERQPVHGLAVRTPPA